jgi:hypothetical protein
VPNRSGAHLREAWERAESDEWRRSLLALVIDKIILHPALRKPLHIAADGTRYRFDTEQVEVIWKYKPNKAENVPY